MVPDEISKFGACHHFLFETTQILASLYTKGDQGGIDYRWKNKSFLCSPLWFVDQSIPRPSVQIRAAATAKVEAEIQV